MACMCKLGVKTCIWRGRTGRKIKILNNLGQNIAPAEGYRKIAELYQNYAVALFCSVARPAYPASTGTAKKTAENSRDETRSFLKNGIAAAKQAPSPARVLG